MGYAVFEDYEARDYGVRRWAGYGVPAPCDYPGCNEKINRGLGYKCESEYRYEDVIEDGEVIDELEIEGEGCNNFFCSKHENLDHKDVEPKPDSDEWLIFLLLADSWKRWRAETPNEVTRVKKYFLRHPLRALYAWIAMRDEIKWDKD